VGPLESRIRIHQLRKQRDPLHTVTEAARLLDSIPAGEKEAAARRGERHFVFWRDDKAVVGCRPGGASGVGRARRVTPSGIETRSLAAWRARLKVEAAKAHARAPLMTARRKLAEAKARYRGTGA
jgi:hypothetical protein